MSVHVESGTGRERLVRRGRSLAWFTIAWNGIEGVAGIVAGVAAGSIALVGFGIDSYVEVFAGSVIIWRLAKDRHGHELSELAEPPGDSPDRRHVPAARGGGRDRVGA